MNLPIRTVVLFSVALIHLNSQASAQNAIEGCFYPLETDSVFEIPDATGTCFEDTLIYQDYPDTLNWEDLTPEEQIIGITLEHSYMGDLIISVTCPSGQQMLLHNQGGGGGLL